VLVVADSSPLIALVSIGHIGILPQLFGTVIIPTAVGVELREAKRPQTIRSFIGNPPTWLIERTPKTIENFPLLDAGEVAAINLALEIKADLLLIDESLGRKAAIARGIHVAGTIGILERAADQQLLDLKVAFDSIK
jgi:predicted nucleic acid-binding protein